MGTTKSGRVLNTRGAAGSASQFAVVHSNEGAYTKPQKDNHIRLKSGGHGQTGLKELDMYQIIRKVQNKKALINHASPQTGRLRTLSEQENTLQS